jgi:hypothetical protein
LIYALCRPERLLDIIGRFSVFDGGTRKVGRHQQFIGIRKAIAHVKQTDLSGTRKSGVIWHTQGSWKSLTDRRAQFTVELECASVAKWVRRYGYGRITQSSAATAAPKPSKLLR